MIKGNSVSNKLFALATLLIALYFLAIDLRDYMVIEFFSEGILYLGKKPFFERFTQWVYLILFVLAGYQFFKVKKSSWFLYQLAASALMIEKLLIYLLNFSLIDGKWHVYYLFPLLPGFIVLAYMNQSKLLLLFYMERRDTYLWLLISFVCGILNFALPRACFYILDLISYFFYRL